MWGRGREVQGMIGSAIRPAAPCRGRRTPPRTQLWRQGLGLSDLRRVRQAALRLVPSPICLASAERFSA